MEITKQIDNFIQRQYPVWYQQNGNNFVQFVTAYYEWLEEEGNALYYARNYYDIKEIDKTLEQFLVHFKQKYFHNIQLGTNSDIRLLIKHATDIYRAKGSQRAVELLFQLAYGEQVEFYYPSRDLFRLSDGVWFKPQYLELSLADNTVQLNQKEVFGVTSGAIAFVDAVVRRFTVGQLQDVAYISAINGTFIAGEAIQPTDMSIDITQCPILKGSLQSIFFPSVGTGSNYTIGDTIPVSSRNGNNALFLVTNTTSESIVTLFFNDGGYGYTTTPNLYLSTVNLTLANLTITNTEPLFNNAWNFLDTLTQPLASINYQNANALFSYGDTIVTYDGGGNITSVGFTIGINEIDANTGQMTIAVNSGNVGSNQQFWTIGNTKTANLTVANGYTDITATGQYIANSANVALVLSNLSKPFVVGEEVIQFNPERNIVWGSGIVQTYDTSRAVLNILMQRGILYPNNQIDGVVSRATANVVSITARIGLINVNNSFIASNIAFVSSNNMSANVNVVDVVQGNVGIGIVNTLNYPETILLGTDQIGPYLTVPIGQNRYNFPGFIAGNLSFGTIGQMLSYSNVTIGKIPNIVFLGSSLTSLTEPFVVVDQPQIRDRQFFDNILSYTGATGSFPIGEIIQQGTTNARGMLRPGSNDSIMILERMRYANDFIVTMNSSTQLSGLLTGFVANCTNVAIDYDSQVMGHNAVIDLTYAVGSGIITEGKVVDSGYGFQQGETIQIGANLAQGIAVVNNYGTGSGYYANVGSFPSGQKRLFDGVYWQNFSYEIQSSLMLSKYQDLMDELTHVAGTQLFGRYIFKASDRGEIDVVGQFRTGNQYGTNTTFIVDTQALLTTQNVHSIIRLSSVTTTFQKRPLQVSWGRVFRGIANFYPAKTVTPARTNLMFTANAAPVTFGHGNRFTKAAVTFKANAQFLQAHGSATFRSFQPQITVTSQFNKSRIPVRTLGIYRVTANLKFGTVFRAITRTLQFQATATGQSLKTVNPLGFRTFGVTATNPRQPVVPGKNTNSVVSTKATPTPRAMAAGRAFTANATVSRLLQKNGGAPYSYSFVMNAAANALSQKNITPTHINLSAVTTQAQKAPTTVQPIRTAIANVDVLGWDPSMLPTLAGLYRADRGVAVLSNTGVTQWNDQGPLAQNLTNASANLFTWSSTSLNGGPGLSVRAANVSILQNLAFKFQSTGNASFFFVTANTPITLVGNGNFPTVISLFATGVTEGAFPGLEFAVGANGTSGNTVIDPFSGGHLASTVFNQGSNNISTPVQNTAVLLWGMSVNSGFMTIYVNGVPVASNTASGGWKFGNTTNALYVGSQSNFTNDLTGTIGLIGMCNNYSMSNNDWLNLAAFTDATWNSNIGDNAPGLIKQVQSNRTFFPVATVPQVKKAVTPTGFSISTATALAIVNKQVGQVPKLGRVESLVYGSSWTPANLTNIVAFYRADQGVSLNPGTNNVVQVLDLSGHGEFLVNTFANCPQLTTVSPFKQPVIAINPGNNSALLQNQLFDSFGANTIGSFWIVTANGVGAINATSTATVMAFLATTGLTGTNSMYLLQGNTAAAGNTVVGAFLENLGAGGEVGGGTAGFGNNIPMASITITGLTIDGTTARVWQNGQVVANSAYSNAIGNTSGVTGFYIGDSTAGIVWQGAFASAGVCKGYAMNANDWANMIAWTNSVWGSNIPLANGSPVGLSKQVQTNRAFTANETFGLLKLINQKRTHQVIAVPLGAGGGNWQHANSAANTHFDLGFNVPTWSHIQGKTDITGSGTSKSVSFTSPIANGSIVVGGVLLGADVQVTSITDDQGNQYIKLNEVGTTGGPLTVTGFRSANAITNGAQTLTFHYQTSPSTVWITMDEFNAGISLAGGIYTDGTQLMNGGTQNTTPKFQTTKANDLLYNVNFSTTSTSNGTGWTVAQGSGSQQMAQWQQAGAASNTANAAYIMASGTNWSTTFGISVSPINTWQLRQNQIQRTANNVSNGSITFVNPIANGSVVIGSIAIGTAGGGDANLQHLIGIQDDMGNEYSVIANTNQLARVVFWSNGVITNSPSTITAKCTQSEVVVYMLANEFIPPSGSVTFGLDGSAGNAPTGAPPITSNTITTVQNGDLIYSFTDNIGANSSPLNGFSVLNGQYMTWCDAYLLQQAAGSVACAWDGTGVLGSDATAIVAFSANSSPLMGRFSVGASVLGANAVGHGI